MPLDTSQTLVFERNRAAATKAALATAAFATLGFWFVVSPSTFSNNTLARALSALGPSPNAITVAIGFAAIAVAALFGAISVRNNRGGSTAVRLSPTGLTVNVGPTTLAELPWREVTGTQVVTVMTAEMLGVLVADVERVLQQQPPGQRILGRMNASSFETPVYIPATMVTAELREIADAIAAYRAAHGDRSQDES